MVFVPELWILQIEHRFSVGYLTQQINREVTFRFHLQKKKCEKTLVKTWVTKEVNK